jgi:hypothetical protein
MDMAMDGLLPELFEPEPPQPTAKDKDVMARNARAIFNRDIETGPIHPLANNDRRRNFVNRLHGVEIV